MKPRLLLLLILTSFKKFLLRPSWIFTGLPTMPLVPFLFGKGIKIMLGDTPRVPRQKDGTLLYIPQEPTGSNTRLSFCTKLLILTLSLFPIAGCSNDEPLPTATPKPEPVTLRFMAGFRPQADLPFVAAYVAKEKGFFAEQGLNVEISHAYQGEHLRLLLANEIDVTTANADSVIRNKAANKAPIKAIALLGQRSEQAYAVLKDSGINSPKDFEGKTVGYRTAATPDYLAMLKLTNTDRSTIKEVPVTFDPRLLTERKVDVYPVFLSNEPFTLKSIGFEVKTFAGADYGVPTLGLTYIVKEDSLAAKMEVYQRFLKAAMKGLYYAQNNIDEAIDITLLYAKDANREQQKYLMTSELERAVTPDTLKNGLGWMTEDQWNRLNDSLLQFNAVAARVPTVDLYDDSLLKSIYKDGTLIWP